MTKSEWASWTQAIFSIVAIGAGAWFIQWQHRLTLKASRLAALHAQIESIEVVRAYFETLSTLIQVCRSDLINDTAVSPAHIKALRDVAKVVLVPSIGESAPLTIRAAIASAQSAVNFSIQQIEELSDQLVSEKATAGELDLQYLDGGLRAIASANKTTETWLDMRRAGTFI